MANNRVCLVCGKAYEYCGSCNGKKLPTWMNLFHDENCRQIFHAVSDYSQNVITKDDGRDKLSGCDLSIEMKDNIKKIVDKIMFVEVSTPSVENENIEESTETSSDEKKPVRRTGRRKVTVVSE